jgi:Lon protease-like protein
VEAGRPPYSDEELDAALDALAEAERFREAESVVAGAAPKLQKVLASALEEGGWFGEAHESQTLKVATTPDQEERITAVRTMLAEEARMGMMVGVAVGWALHEELSKDASEGDS